MATFEELDSLIGPLKRAAIDAYMRSDGWGPWKWQIRDDYYEYIHPSAGTFGPTTEEVTRPDADGNGGGDWRMRIPLAPDPDQEPGKYAPDFDTVRGRIDDALERWKDLPDPQVIGDEEESMRQANRALAFEAVAANGGVTGGGEIGGNINLILENSDAMAGGMITAFKSDFLAQMSKAIAGHHALTIVLGGVLAAEGKIWEGARQTVADIVVDSTEAFNAAAEQGDLSWDVVLKVAGFAVAGAAIFATGGAATGLAVAGLGIKILDAAIPADGSGSDTEAPGGDYDSAMSAFEGTLDDLDTAIETEEKILDDNLSATLQQVGSDHSSYDLTRPPLMDVDDDSDLGAPSEILIRPILVKEITGTFMPRIAAELETASSSLITASLLTYRDSSIGLDTNGPSANYYELRYLVYELIKNLSQEIAYSAQSLQLAVEDMQITDTEAEDALEAHARKIREEKVGMPGSWNDPWN